MAAPAGAAMRHPGGIAGMRRAPVRLAAARRRPAAALSTAYPLPPARRADGGPAALFGVSAQIGVRILQLTAAILAGATVALAVINYREAGPAGPAVPALAPQKNETVIFRQPAAKFAGRATDTADHESNLAAPSHYPRLVQTVRFFNPRPVADKVALATLAPDPEATFSLASASTESVPAPRPVTKDGGFAALPANESVQEPPAASEAARPVTRNGSTVRLDEVDDYLWEVYRRLPVKRDSSGDFSWKDPAAAKRIGLSLEDYVIVGMDPDFREQLYHAGKAMDAAGLQWAMLSAFRDDYRQNLASGFKARGGYSLHGGSVRTGGYGHGRAIDIISVNEDDASAVWQWIDANGSKYGLYRPMPGADPAHLQSKGDWRKLAQALRESRGVRLAFEVRDVRPADLSGSGKEASRRRTRFARYGKGRHGS
jgi:hypothetical protein